MTRPVPPALAFYTRHPHDNDALGELPSRPEGVPEADWQKWGEVIALAGQQAGTLVTQCRDEALTVLAGRVKVVSRCRPKTAARYWYSWAEVFAKGASRKPFKLWVGAGVASDPKEAVWVGAYVSVSGGAARIRALREALADAGVDHATGDTTWFGTDSVPLAFIPLRGDSDLDKIAGESREAFERLLAGLPQMTFE